MYIPLKNKENNKDIRLLSELLSGLNESYIIEKNNKNFFYEIDCIIMDIHKHKLRT